MAEVVVEVDEPFIRVRIAGARDEPMNLDKRQAEATRAAKQHVGSKVSLLTGGGGSDRTSWWVGYTFVPAGYKFPKD